MAKGDPIKSEEEVKKFRGYGVTGGYVTTKDDGSKILTLTKDGNPYHYSTKPGEIKGWEQLGTQSEEKAKKKFAHSYAQQSEKIMNKPIKPTEASILESASLTPQHSVIPKFTLGGPKPTMESTIKKATSVDQPLISKIPSPWD